MYQLIRRILADPNDQTRIRLLYANKSPQDVLLRQELEELASQHPERLSILLTVDAVEGPIPAKVQGTTPSPWTGEVGLVQSRMVRALFPPPAANSTATTSPASFLALVCGSDGFVEHVAGKKGETTATSGAFQGRLGGILRELGYAEGQVYKL